LYSVFIDRYSFQIQFLNVIYIEVSHDLVYNLIGTHFCVVKEVRM